MVTFRLSILDKPVLDKLVVGGGRSCVGEGYLTLASLTSLNLPTSSVQVFRSPTPLNVHIPVIH